MEALSQIIIKHEVGDDTYISKATTEEDLRLAVIYLIECPPSPPRVITLSFLIAEVDVARLDHAFDTIPETQKND